jgi:MFS family permease
MTDESRELEGQSMRTGAWLNRHVFAFGLTSLMSDFCHDMATAVLPQFMQTIGASAAALGFIEGVADALSSFVKLGAGYHSDRIGHRKTWTVIGYFLTAIAKPVFAFAFAWPLILIGRVVGWLGRGIRSPLRDAMLAESVSSQDRGKAFGFHRAGDTAGAVLGPLAAFALLDFLAGHPGAVEALARWVPSLSGAGESSPPGPRSVRNFLRHFSTEHHFGWTEGQIANMVDTIRGYPWSMNEVVQRELYRTRKGSAAERT